jgi:hypothetical protein
MKPSEIYLRAAQLAHKHPGLYASAIYEAGGDRQAWDSIYELIGWPNSTEERVIALLLMSAMYKSEGR